MNVAHASGILFSLFQASDTVTSCYQDQTVNENTQITTTPKSELIPIIMSSNNISRSSTPSLGSDNEQTFQADFTEPKPVDRVQPWRKFPELDGKDKVHITEVSDNMRLFGNAVNAHS
jgi:hypothetical protein